MSSEPLSFIQSTDPALLFRLRNWEDRASWSEFYRLYHDFVYRFARRSGLSHADAQEVTQDVFKGAAEAIHGFESDPRRGKFRGWIMTLARWRISDKFRARHPHERQLARSDFQSGAWIEPGEIEGLPDNREIESSWESEWQLGVIETALNRISRRVPAKHFQVFDLYGRQNWPAHRVADALGVNRSSIYLIHHRLTKLLREEIKRLEEQLH
jgi:RNA polymerase sigma-70 factor (ECF subfamily)